MSTQQIEQESAPDEREQAQPQAEESAPSAGEESAPEHAESDQASAPESEDTETEERDESAPDEPGAVVTLRSRDGRGVLSIRADQDKFNRAQVTGLRAIGIQTAGEDAVPVEFIWQFLHTCQKQDLDPWLREAYLITHGKRFTKNNGEVVDNRKFTLVTGIDGFRAKAEATGTYRGQVGPEWLDANGVWHDFWVKGWGDPVAARVGVLRAGFDVPVYGVAMFEEYVPMVDVYAEQEQQGRSGSTYTRRVKTGEKKPTDMWQKMPANQLAKCAEAQALRKAFPRTMSGLYEASEMDRARSEYDNQQAEDREQQRSQARRDAYLARSIKGELSAPTESTTILGEVVEEQRGGEPVRAGVLPPQAAERVREHTERAPESAPADRAPQAESAPRRDPREVQREAEERAQRAVGSAPRPGVRHDAGGLSPADALRLVRSEITWQAEQLGTDVATLTRRDVDAAGKPLGQFSVEELLRVAVKMRSAVTHSLRRVAPELASTYERVGERQYIDVLALSGQEPGEPAVDAPEGNEDPTAPHSYRDAAGVGACAECGDPEDVPQHF